MQFLSNIQEKFPINKIKSFLFSFYIIGLIGIIIPQTRNIFFFLTPFALLFNFILLLIYHEGELKLKNYLSFIFIFLGGIVIEVIGVKTGFPFGEYYYGKGLGIKIMEVPIIIGMNWLMLVYITYELFSFIKQEIMRVISAAATMVIYDVIVEQVAGFMDMWHFTPNVPLKNYIAWFVLSLIFVGIFSISKIKYKNPLSITIITVQAVFFILIFVFTLLI